MFNKCRTLKTGRAMKSILMIVSIFFITEISLAAKFKMRAREHYEFNQITTNGVSEDYNGFTNTLNFFWEEPYKYSFGLAVSPMLSAIEEDVLNSSLGEDVWILNVGVELKYFVQDFIKNVYVRPGIYYTELRPDAPIADFKGVSIYAGLGYEHAFSKLGLALEVGYRYTDLNRDAEITSVVPSLGVHFYKDL